MQREQRTQTGFVNFLTCVLPCQFELIKIDNEGRKGKGNKKSEGFRKGASDLVLVVPAIYTPSTIWIETKTLVLTVPKTAGTHHFKSTKQTPEQIDFQQSMEKLGHQYWLAPDVERLAVYIENWCKENNLVSRLSDNDKKLLLEYETRTRR